MDTKNHKFFKTKKWYRSRPATKKELRAARALALERIKNNNFAVRSCWQCNGAHEYFLSGDKNWCFTCFECGRWYAQNVDVTDYTE